MPQSCPSVLRSGGACVILLIALTCAAPALSQTVDLTRRYVAGEQFGYHLVQTEARAGETARLEATTAHQVIFPPDGAPFERIRWTRLGDAAGPDAEAAARLPAYALSLVAGQSLESPRPGGSVDLLGMVTDLQTFYVAVSPGLGIDRLKAPGDVWVRPDLVIGDFQDGDAILSGRDCTRATLRLVAIEADDALVETRFDPPAASCLGSDSADAGVLPDNFQMTRRSGQGLLILHGAESFVILSRLDIHTGQLLEAEMTNRLDLTGRVCADETPDHCTALPPIHRVRRVTLQKTSLNGQ